MNMESGRTLPISVLRAIDHRDLSKVRSAFAKMRGYPGYSEAKERFAFEVLRLGSSKRRHLKFLEDSLRFALDELGVDLHSKNALGEGLLYRATKTGMVPLIHVLLDRGLVPLTTDKLETSPVSAAVYSQNQEAVRLLLPYLQKVDNDWSCHLLAIGVNNDDPEMVKLLTQLGANPNVEWGWHLPVWARALKCPRLLGAMIGGGARIDTLFMSPRGGNVLHEWIFSCEIMTPEKEEVCRLLLNNGVDPCVVNNEGLTPIALAKSLGREDAARVISCWLVQQEANHLSQATMPAHRLAAAARRI